MAIVTESVTETLVGTNDSTPTFNMPATRPDGDLYVITAGCDGAITTYYNNLGTPFSIAGELGDEGSVGACARGRVGSSEPASYTVTGDSEEYVFYLYRLSGTDNTLSDGASGTGNSTAASAPAATADAGGNDLVIRVWCIDTDNPTYNSGPTGHTFRGGSSSSAGGAGSCYVGTATRDALTTSSESIAAATMPGTYDDNWVGLTVIVDVGASSPVSTTVTGVAATITADAAAGAVLIGRTIPGEAATVTADAATGAVATVNIVSIAGVAATVSADAAAGVVAAQVQTSITGVAATVDADAAAGAVQIARAIPGEAATMTADAAAGAVTATSSTTIAGEAATVTADAPAGSVAIARSIPGEAATVDVDAAAGAVAAVRIVSIAGEAATMTADAPAGAVAAQVQTSITGESATMAADALAGTVTALSAGSASVAGEAATMAADAATGAVAALQVVSIAGEAASMTADAAAGAVVAQISVSIEGVAATTTADAAAGAVVAIVISVVSGGGQPSRGYTNRRQRRRSRRLSPYAPDRALEPAVSSRPIPEIRLDRLTIVITLTLTGTSPTARLVAYLPRPPVVAVLHPAMDVATPTVEPVDDPEELFILGLT